MKLNYKLILIFYVKFKFKLVKFTNFERPLPNFSAPSAPIPL